MHEKIVQECRGIILDENDNWRVVSRAFDKFFNYQESLAAEIDWSTAKVQEKLDGSMMVVYPYKDEWLVQSSGSPDASGNVGSESYTFAELFWQTAKECGLDLPPTQHGLCFTFELMTPHNRVVVPYTKSKITLIGVRDVVTQREISVDQFYHIGTGFVKSFSLNSIENIIASFDYINPLSQEGYVVVDTNFNRIKVKHPGYVAIHHLKDQASDKNFVEIIRTGETSELVSYFPDFNNQMENLKFKYEILVSKIQEVWEVTRCVASQKDFALLVKNLPYSGILFCLRNGKITSVKQGLKEMRIENLMELMK